VSPLKIESVIATNRFGQGRDLYLTTDIRSVFKGILAEHLGVPAEYLEREVFPYSGSAPITTRLIHS
jgi:uncharacterized protein (DUF1501 family)